MLVGIQSPRDAASRGSMSKLSRHLIFLLVASSTFVPGGRAQAQPSAASAGDACLAFKKEMSLGTSLPRTRTKLKAGETLVVVALGSSSTTGFGLLRSGGAFPDVMKQELLRLRPSARIELIIADASWKTFPRMSLASIAMFCATSQILWCGNSGVTMRCGAALRTTRRKCSAGP